MRKLGVILLALVGLASTVKAQDLGNIGKQPPVKVSGGINTTAIAYHAQGIESRRDPFNWFLTGNINLSLYGWNVPFSFSYSNQNKTFRQPFNQFGVAPHYKWAKAYVGYNTLNYSSYTLAGHLFLGGAVELTPGKFRFNAMYGQLNRAVEEDTLSNENVIPAFQRMGYGMKVGYGDNQNFIDLIIFGASDDINSLNTIPDSTEVLPQENLVFSLVGKKQLTKRIGVNAEWATSAITRDTRAPETNGGRQFFSAWGGLFSPRESTQYYDAVKASLFYAGNAYTLQANYERVDPGYQTLGTYFFNNDLENITVSTSVRMFQSKLNLSANVGTQRNNLDDTEVSAVERVVSSASLNYIPNQKWNFNGTYSNFTTFTNVRPRFDPFFQDDLDTLNFYQVNQNASAAVAYNFGDQNRKHGLFFNGSYQIANEESDSETQEDSQTTFFSGNVAYRYGLVPKNMNIAVALNFNHSELPGNQSTTFGPNVSVSRAFLEKTLRTTVSTSFNRVENNGEVGSQVFNMRLNGSYKLKDHHTFSLNAIMLRRLASVNTENPFTEYTITMNYGYRF
ncbi:MAG: hypothetical protein AAFX87_15535 [Bacteroidota bacterium]